MYIEIRCLPTVTSLLAVLCVLSGHLIRYFCSTACLYLIKFKCNLMRLNVDTWSWAAIMAAIGDPHLEHDMVVSLSGPQTAHTTVSNV